MARKQLKKGDKVKFVSGNYYNLTGGESMFDGKRLIILSKNINFDGITKMPMFKSFD